MIRGFLIFFLIFFLGCKTESKSTKLKTIIGDIIVDGNEDLKWRNTERNPIHNIVHKPNFIDNNEDLSANFKTLKDSNNLYFLFNVIDEKVYARNPPPDKKFYAYWDYDYIELFFDSKLKDGKSIKKSLAVLYGIDTSMGNIDSFKKAFRKTKTGYIVELSISLRELTYSLTEIESLKFEVQIGDNDKKFITEEDFGGGETVLSWASTERIESNMDNHPLKCKNLKGKLNL